MTPANRFRNCILVCGKMSAVNMSRLFFAIALLPVLGVATLVTAQQNAPGGDFHNWTKDEVKKVLFDSPWSRTIDWRAQPTDTRQLGSIVPPIVTARILLR